MYPEFARFNICCLLGFKFFKTSLRIAIQLLRISLDLNMTVSINKGQISRYLKTLMHKKDFFIEEPSLIFFEMGKILKVLKRKALNAFKKL